MTGATHTVPLRRLALVLAFALPAAHAESERAPEPVTAESLRAARADEAAQRMAALAAEIEAAIGHPYAVQAAQCRVLSLGVSPCGGAERYLAYSTLNGGETQLQQLASQYNIHARIAAWGAPRGECAPRAGAKAVLADSVCRLAGE